MSGETTGRDTGMTRLENRVLSAFQDPDRDAEIMAKTHQRLLGVMAGGVRAPRRRPASVLGPLAATLMLAIVAGIAGWRLVGQRVAAPRVLKPPTTTKAVPVVPSVNPLNCKLPVHLMLESGPPGQFRQEVGFVDTHGGLYVRDASASVMGLPGGGSPGTTSGKPAQLAAPRWYSASLGRWLPVAPPGVSPDGRSYLWGRLVPEGSLVGPNFQKDELHRYDVLTATDRTLWTYPGSINVVRWDASGILVHTVPPAGGRELSWIVDPETGNAVSEGVTPAPALIPPFTRLPGDPRPLGAPPAGAVLYEDTGVEFQGHTLFRLGSRDPRSVEWVFYEIAPGQRVTIYRGIQGDSMGFDPSFAIADRTGIWFGDYSGAMLWRWQQGSGLQKLPLTGLPNRISGPNSSVFVDPVAPCI